MFDGGSQNVAFLRMSGQGALDRRVVALRAATGKDDFARVGIDQRCDPGTRLLQMPRQLAPEEIRARRIAPKLRQKGRHRLYHFGRNPGRGVVVKIINLPPLHTHPGSVPFPTRASRLTIHAPNTVFSLISRNNLARLNPSIHLPLRYPEKCTLPPNFVSLIIVSVTGRSKPRPTQISQTNFDGSRPLHTTTLAR